MRYLDFDVYIERAAHGYRVQVNSPGGQATHTFTLPFSDLELENFILRLGHSPRGVRRIDSPEVEAAKSFGARLFTAVCGDDVRSCLRSSLDEASRQNVGLRIRLRLNNTPELADLPWEYLYNQTLNRFLALSVETPIVRYLELPERIRPLSTPPPLRVLAIIASPKNHPPLNVEREWIKLNEALADLVARGLVAVERLNPATFPALQQRLRRGTCHILHFVGHGGFDKHLQDGVLILEDEDGLGHRVSGQDLGVLLHDHRPLRLVILNACEGARGARDDPFAGTAQSLVQQGVPAVIAMQFEVTDEAAIVLAHEFYSAVADGYPVDAALTEARRAVFTQGRGVEWGTPVLYLRAPDAHIFDITPSALVDAASVRPPAVGTAPQIQPQANRRGLLTALGVMSAIVIFAAIAFVSRYGLLNLGGTNIPTSAPAIPTSASTSSVGGVDSTQEPQITAPPLVSPVAVEPTDPLIIAFTSEGDDGNEDIYKMRADGSGITRLTTHPALDRTPSWSSDHSRIVFESRRDNNNWEIFVMNADGSGQTNLTHNQADDGLAAWSPDGSKIVFRSNRDGKDELYIMNADGSSQERLTFNPDSDDSWPTWSSDGSRIAFNSDRDGNWNIFVMSLSDRKVTRLTDDPAIDEIPVWSPDGTRLAFESDRGGSFDIFVMNADGSGQTRLTTDSELDEFVTWSLDGTQLAFSTNRNDNWDVYVMNADGSEQKQLTHNPKTDWRPTWSPR
jgi:hypothetical protein